MWVTEEQLGQKWANMLLKCRKCHFRNLRTQKRPRSRVPAPPVKFVLHVRRSLPSVNSSLCACARPKPMGWLRQSRELLKRTRADTDASSEEVVLSLEWKVTHLVICLYEKGCWYHSGVVLVSLNCD